jgi:hypothetical protein
MIKYRSNDVKICTDRIKLLVQKPKPIQAKSLNGLRRKYLRRMVQIIDMLNRPEVELMQLIKPDKWLRKRQFGGLNWTEYNEDLPFVQGFSMLGKGNKYSVEYAFNEQALPYIDYIFRGNVDTPDDPDKEVLLPKFIRWQETAAPQTESATTTNNNNVKEKPKAKNKR